VAAHDSAEQTGGDEKWRFQGKRPCWIAAAAATEHEAQTRTRPDQSTPIFGR
jgi:hypothetical protein